MQKKASAPDRPTSTSPPRRLMRQIIPFGRDTDGHVGYQVIDHIGGYSRGYLPTHSRSWPLGRPWLWPNASRPTVFLCSGARGVKVRICRGQGRSMPTGAELCRVSVSFGRITQNSFPSGRPGQSGLCAGLPDADPARPQRDKPLEFLLAVLRCWSGRGARGALPSSGRSPP